MPVFLIMHLSFMLTGHCMYNSDGIFKISLTSGLNTVPFKDTIVCG